VIAGKTGTTDNAKECLISIVEQDGRETLVVLLHSDNRYGDMQTILDALPK
jgi:D-alanyl-D-alanine carboxypeptidase